jgi:hypothetical protein
MILRPGFQIPTTGLSSPVVFCVGLPLMIIAPLIRGGNRAVALMLLNAIAIALLVFVAMSLGKGAGRGEGIDSARHGLTPSALVLALSPLWVALLQLVPFPWLLWVRLPGHEPYVGALEAVQALPIGWLPVSLIPDVTWISVFAGLPITAMFLLALLITNRQLATLTQALVLIALFQSVVGLLQVSLFKVLYFDAMAYERAIGSFANPNHYAAFIAMVLPLTIVHLRLRLRHRASRGAGGRGALAGALWSAVLFVQLAGLLASLSRAGVAVGVLFALLTVLWIPMRDLDRRSRWWRLAGSATLGLLVLATVGFQGMASRLTDLSSDSSRALMFRGAWDGALTFWPFGSGLGTFAGVFPRFQPSGLSGLVEFAHSDYVQLLMECGLLAVLLASVALALLARQSVAMVRLDREHGLDVTALLQASCGLGLLAVLLHSWVDFNLRIPANAMLAAFLFGAFLRPLSGTTGRQQEVLASN